jgi:hypothetical protein
VVGDWSLDTAGGSSSGPEASGDSFYWSLAIANGSVWARVNGSAGIGTGRARANLSSSGIGNLMIESANPNVIDGSVSGNYGGVGIGTGSARTTGANSSISMLRIENANVSGSSTAEACSGDWE